MIDRPYPGDRPRHTALHLAGADAAYLASKARRGGHDLLSRGLDRVAEVHRQAGKARLGIAD